MQAKHTTRHQHPSATKDQFIGAVTAGENIVQAARRYSLPDSTARDIIKKFQQTGSTENLPRSGRPQKLTDADKRQLIRTARKERRTPLAEIGNELGFDVSDTTIRHVLSSAGYHRRVARKVPYLNKRHRAARLAWAKLFRSFSPQNWQKIIWSDESYIYLGEDRGRIYVTRRADEVYLEECLVPTFKQSPIRVMVWGCIMGRKKGPLVVLDYPGGKGGGMNSTRYCEQVLNAVLKHFYTEAKQEHGQVKFQQDNARCHVSKSTKKWLDDNCISLFPHPPNSPDLSPIEPVWHELKKILRHRQHLPTSVGELKAAVHAAWDALDVADIDKYVLTMPQRVTAVLQAKGGHTRY